MFTMRKYIVSLGGKRYIALKEIKLEISVHGKETQKKYQEVMASPSYRLL